MKFVIAPSGAMPLGAEPDFSAAAGGTSPSLRANISEASRTIVWDAAARTLKRPIKMRRQRAIPMPLTKRDTQ
jgi:hypothetical protein